MTPRSAIASLLFVSWLLIGEAKLPKPKYHGRAIPQRELDTRYSNTKKKIVLIHNFYRAKVEPPASNMLEMPQWTGDVVKSKAVLLGNLHQLPMSPSGHEVRLDCPPEITKWTMPFTTWHKGAQRAAQGWAEACQLLTHDDPLGRWVEDYGSCGQNIFVSSTQVDWMYVAKAWYMEHKNFTYGSSKNNLADVGHYTQMVWYSSHRVGCGFHYCGKDVAKRPFYNYVCNYCPIGNSPRSMGRPYQAGRACGKCAKYCKYKKLCTNSCPFSDLWVNCGDLHTTWSSWLCGNEGNERFKSCQATCKCPHAVH